MSNVYQQIIYLLIMININLHYKLYIYTTNLVVSLYIFFIQLLLIYFYSHNSQKTQTTIDVMFSIN